MFLFQNQFTLHDFSLVDDVSVKANKHGSAVAYDLHFPDQWTGFNQLVQMMHYLMHTTIDNSHAASDIYFSDE